MTKKQRRLHLHLFRRCCQLYVEPRDGWIGVYLAETALYVCLLPFIVLRVSRERW